MNFQHHGMLFGRLKMLKLFYGKINLIINMCYDICYLHYGFYAKQYY